MARQRSAKPKASTPEDKAVPVPADEHATPEAVPPSEALPGEHAVVPQEDGEAEEARRVQGQRLTEAERIASQNRFLAMFRISGNVRMACQASKVSRQTYYNWREADTSFADACVDAQEEAVEFLESKGFEFAVEGIERPIMSRGEVVYEKDEDGAIQFDKHGKPKVATYREPNVQLLMFLLKARKPERYRERPPKVEVNASVYVAEHKERLLDKLRALPEPAVVEANVENVENAGSLLNEEK